MSDSARENGLREINTSLLNQTATRIETEGTLKRMARSSNIDRQRAESEANVLGMEKRALQKKYQETKATLERKEALLNDWMRSHKEWMHSSEAFKRLARKYGNKLGVSDEQRQNDYEDCLLDAAEEKPEFAETRATKEVKRERGIE